MLFSFFDSSRTRRSERRSRRGLSISLGVEDADVRLDEDDNRGCLRGVAHSLSFSSVARLSLSAVIRLSFSLSSLLELESPGTNGEACRGFCLSLLCLCLEGDGEGVDLAGFDLERPLFFFLETLEGEGVSRGRSRLDGDLSLGFRLFLGYLKGACL